MTRITPEAADAFALAYRAAAHVVPVQMIQGGGSTNDCPVCHHEHNMGDYPDHMRDLGPGQTFDFECEECGATWETKVEFEPIFWCRSDTVRSMSRRAG